MQKTDLRQHIAMLQGYYKFLYLGKFLEQVIKQNDLSTYVVDMPIDTGDSSFFMLKGKKIERILSEIYKNPDKQNVFGYMVETSAFKGIFGTIRELIENNKTFSDFLEKELQKQYFPFEQVIRFVRNVFMHSRDSNISIKKDDYLKQKVYLLEQEKNKIILSFKYSKYISEWKGSEDYGLHITINFAKIKPGLSLFDIISTHDLYLLAELCFNLSEIFRYKYKL